MFEKCGGLFTIDVTIIIYARVLSSRSIQRRAFKCPAVNKTRIALPELSSSNFRSGFVDKNRKDSPLGKFHRIRLASLGTGGRRILGRGSSFFSPRGRNLQPALKQRTFLSVHEPLALLSLHCHLPYRAASPSPLSPSITSRCSRDASRRVP